MARLAALLRGINVGGNNLLPMATLRALLEGLGYRDVATLLASGNAVFTCKERQPSAVAARIEAAILGETGLRVATLVRTRDELAEVVRRNPFPDADRDASRFQVFFLAREPDPAWLAALDPAAYRPDVLRVDGREIYAHFPGGMGRSKLAAVLTAKRLGATARNFRTVSKLLALAGP